MAKNSRVEILEGLSEDFTRPATTAKREAAREKPLLSPKERKKAKEVDPWITQKERYKVNLAELLKVNVPELIEGNSEKNATATKYLLFDNYFEKVMVEGIEALEEEGVDLPQLAGEEQILYFWFYRKSYGFGYRACPMSHNELRKKLGWSRNTIKKHLKSLQEKGIIKPILSPFKTERPTVYEVVFPRRLLEERLNQIREDRRDKAALKAMEEIRKKLGSKYDTIRK